MAAEKHSGYVGGTKSGRRKGLPFVFRATESCLLGIMFALIAAPVVANAPRRRENRRRSPLICSATTPTQATGAPKWNSKWPTGIPPEMGGHVMPDGRVAPVSKSTGCGTGPKHTFLYHEAETDSKVEVRAVQHEKQNG